MATNAKIAVLTKEGQVKEITCHFDGYLSITGLYLTTYYKTQKAAEALVSLGDISSLNRSLIETKKESLAEKRGHFPGMNTYGSKKEFLCNESGFRYNYFFESGKWHLVFDGYLIPITSKML